MRITRIYADEQGENHFADIDIPVRDAGQIGHLSEPMKATIFGTPRAQRATLDIHHTGLTWRD